MRFLADMGISPKTVEFLRGLGYEVIHLHEESLDALPDPLILNKALHERRILLTSDLDFSELVAASGAKLPSVISFRLKDMRPDNVNRHLARVLEHDVDALTQGAVISVTEERIRVRLLPIEKKSGQ